MNNSKFSFELPSCDLMESICYNYRLDGVDVFELLSDDEKQSNWNGFGPDRFPRKLRTLLSLHEIAILPACYIHDMDYVVGGSKKQFYESNKRLRKNALVCIKKKEHIIGFFYKNYLQIKLWLLEKICNLFGYKGWNKK